MSSAHLRCFGHKVCSFQCRRQNGDFSKPRSEDAKYYRGDGSPPQVWVHTVAHYSGVANGVTSGSEWQGRGWKEPSPVTQQTAWTRISIGQPGLANLCGRKRLLMTCFEKLNVLFIASHVTPLKLPETDIIVPNL